MGLYVTLWALCVALAAVLYHRRGRPALYGALAGLLLGPVGILLAVVSSPDAAALEARQIAGGAMRRCPSCGELARQGAAVCPHCQRALPALRAFPRPDGRGGFACSSCGAAVGVGDAACASCRAPLSV